MLTTLTQRALVDFVVKYQFFNNKLTLIIETDAAHNVLGSVNVELADCEFATVYTDVHTVLEDVFNRTYSFTAVSDTRLECSLAAVNGFNPSIEEITVGDNGDSITATIDNIEISIPKGKYTFKLIDTAASVFDGALITFQELNIASIGEVSYDGDMDSFAETTEGSYQTVDNQELTFQFSAKMALSNQGSNTNIPILFI